MYVCMREREKEYLWVQHFVQRNLCKHLPMLQYFYFNELIIIFMGVLTLQFVFFFFFRDVLNHLSSLYFLINFLINWLLWFLPDPLPKKGLMDLWFCWINSFLLAELKFYVTSLLTHKQDTFTWIFFNSSQQFSVQSLNILVFNFKHFIFL